jgi:hypothetical protein
MVVWPGLEKCESTQTISTKTEFDLGTQGQLQLERKLTLIRRGRLLIPILASCGWPRPLTGRIPALPIRTTSLPPPEPERGQQQDERSHSSNHNPRNRASRQPSAASIRCARLVQKQLILIPATLAPRGRQDILVRTRPVSTGIDAAASHKTRLGEVACEPVIVALADAGVWSYGVVDGPIKRGGVDVRAWVSRVGVGVGAWIRAAAADEEGRLRADIPRSARGAGEVAVFGAGGAVGIVGAHCVWVDRADRSNANTQKKSLGKVGAKFGQSMGEV